MQLTTARFGTIEFDSEAVITFTQPIIGFEQRRRFILVPGPDGGFVKWLQSTESPDLAFLIMDPRAVVADYEIEVTPADLNELGANDTSLIEAYTLVVVPKDPSQIRTNLKAPILINPVQRLAKQAVLDRTDYPVQFFFARNEGHQGAPKAQEEVG